MYRLLIVDDEAGHRAGMVGLLRILKPEYLVFEAENGAAALSMMDVVDFDLVLTDIRMPQMDGIAFLEQAKARRSRARIAILSAYGLFDYAKRCIALGADDYLLKPVDADDLRACLDKMENRLESGHAANHSGDDVEQMMYRVVSGAMPPAEQSAVRALFGELQSGAVVHALRTSGWTDSDAKGGAQMDLRQQLKRFGRAVAFQSPVEAGALIGVVACPAHVLAELVAALERFCAEGGSGLTIGIGPCEYELFDQLEDAHSRARAACMRQFFEPERLVFVVEAGKAPDPFLSVRPDVSIKALDAYLGTGDVAQAEQLLLEQIARLSAPGAYPSKLKEAVMYTFIFLMGSLSSPLPQRDKDAILAEVDRTVLESRSLPDMRSQVRSALRRIAEAIDESRRSQREDAFQRVLDYLSDHFQQDLSLAGVAERFHYHPSYFSTLFKQNAGTTFSDYLFELRMIEAARLLKGSGLFAAKVGQRVGYPNATYFTKAFKKRFGMSPDQYRKHGGAI